MFTAGNSPYLEQRLPVPAGWSAMHAHRSPHCRLPVFQCAWVDWTRKLTAEQSRSKSCRLSSVDMQHCSRWCIVTKFQTLISCSNDGLSKARTHWTKQLIWCQKDWLWLSRQRVVMLNFFWSNHMC